MIASWSSVYASAGSSESGFLSGSVTSILQVLRFFSKLICSFVPEVEGRVISGVIFID